MAKYIIRRIIQLLPVILGITLLSFFLIQSTSKDAVDAIYENTGGYASEDVKEALREELGLNEPLYKQYINWLTGTMKGDMGASFVTGKPVFTEFMSKLPATFFLMAVSVVITTCFSLPMGMLSAVKKDTGVDFIIRFATFAGNSMPGYLVSLLLIYIFSVRLNLLPVIGGEGLRGVIMPSIALSFAMVSKYTRQIRAVIIEELEKNYVYGLRSRGVREWKILLVSVLKAALPSIVTLLGLSIGSLLGGTAIIESIFMWDGVGKMAIDAILMRDYPVILAYVVWMAFIYVLINLITDLLYRYLDPRVNLADEGA